MNNPNAFLLDQTLFQPSYLLCYIQCCLLARGHPTQTMLNLDV